MTAKRNITAFFIISILGTLGHFLYEWSGRLYAVGLFFPVNESTWEHLKLLFFPAIIYFSAEYFKLKPNLNCFISSTAISLLAGMVFIVVFYYTYSGVIGKNIDFLNILSYYLGVMVMLGVNQLELKEINTPVFIVIIILFAALFPLFSYNPPPLGIFAQPVLDT